MHISNRQAFAEFCSDPQRFDLLVTDHQMPRMTGIELVEKTLSVRPDLPVLMVSGTVGSLSLEQLKARGVRWLLTKPYLCEDLKAMVRTLLPNESRVV